MTRPTLERYFLDLAKLTATRSTCLRRAVGCVLTNERGEVLATGYNGVPRGLPHCNEIKPVELQQASGGPLGLALRDREVVNTYPFACTGSNAPSGSALDSCYAVHAEQNALLQCGDVSAIHTCYVTVTPCETCLKLLLNTSCRRIVAVELYGDAGSDHQRALNQWWVGRERGLLILSD